MVWTWQWTAASAPTWCGRAFLPLLLGNGELLGPGRTSIDDTFKFAPTVKNIGDKRYLLSGILTDAIYVFEGGNNRSREWSFTASVMF